MKNKPAVNGQQAVADRTTFDHVKLAGTVERHVLKDQIVQHVHTIVALEIADLLYIKSSADRFNTLKAQVQADNAAWPALASEFVDNVSAWSVGLDCKDAKAYAKGLKKAAKAHFKTVLESSQTRTLDTYIGQLCKGASLSPQVSVVKSFTPDGVPSTLYGWTIFSKMVAGTAGSETADDCLVRVCKAIDTHAGSQVTPGIVNKDMARTMVGLLFQSLGKTAMLAMIDQAQADMQAAQPAPVTVDNKTDAERRQDVGAVILEAAAA
jgi:hypothetical protein